MDATRFDVWRLARKGRKLPGPPIVSEENGIRFVELADAFVRARLVGNPSADRVVVLCPDPPNVIEHYDELIALLSPYVKVLCFELPGFGFSIPKTSFEFDVETYARTVIELLVDKLGVRRATLAFPCVTSFIALAAARKRPDLVERLVLAQAAGHTDTCAWMRRVDRVGLSTPWIGQLFTWLAPKTIARMWYRAAVGAEQNPDRLAWHATEALRQGAAFCLASAFQAFKRADAKKLSGANVPAVVVWGESDRTHGPTDRNSMQAHLGSVQVVRFFGNGHFPDLESSLRFAQGILGFAVHPEIAAQVAILVAAGEEARVAASKKKQKKEKPVPVPAEIPVDRTSLSAPAGPDFAVIVDPQAPVDRTRVSADVPVTRTAVTKTIPGMGPATLPAASLRPLPTVALAPLEPEPPPSFANPNFAQSSVPSDFDSGSGFEPLPPQPRPSLSSTSIHKTGLIPAWPSASAPQIQQNIAPDAMVLDSLSVEPLDAPRAPPPRASDSLELQTPIAPRRPPAAARAPHPPHGAKPAPHRPARRSRMSPGFALHALVYVILDIAALSSLALIASGLDPAALGAAFFEGAWLARPATPFVLSTALLAPIAVVMIGHTDGFARFLVASFVLPGTAIAASALSAVLACPLANGFALEACGADTSTRLASLTSAPALGFLFAGAAAIGVLHAAFGPRSR